MTTRDYRNFINGEWVNASTGQSHENRNPANKNDLIGTFPLSNEKDLNAAVAAAKEAQKSWRLVPAPKRAEVLYKAAELILQNKEAFSRT